MDKKALEERDIKEAEKLIKALDKSKFKVRAAMWFYLTDSDEWRLIIASPFVEENGPKWAYNFVQKELARLTPHLNITLKDISVLSPKDELIKILRKGIRIGPGISGIRFSRNVINNILIEDAYIFRLL